MATKEIDIWEAERKRRIKYMRRQAWREAVRKNRVELAIMVAIFLGFLAFLVIWNCYLAPLGTAAAVREAEEEYDAQVAAAGGYEKMLAADRAALVAKLEGGR